MLVEFVSRAQTYGCKMTSVEIWKNPLNPILFDVIGGVSEENYLLTI